MAEEDLNCPESCPFLEGSNDFCRLFMQKLKTTPDMIWRCEKCLDPKQRKSAVKVFDLRGMTHIVNKKENNSDDKKVSVNKQQNIEIQMAYRQYQNVRHLSR